MVMFWVGSDDAQSVAAGFILVYSCVGKLIICAFILAAAVQRCDGLLLLNRRRITRSRSIRMVTAASGYHGSTSMVIRKSQQFRYSQVTPQATYWNRGRGRQP